jgi:hypothetical protein
MRRRRSAKMQNAHLRLGRLEYQRSSVKTNTHIAVHVSHYVGEKEQAHLLSYFGNDAEVAAVTAAIQENHRFELAFPDGSRQKIGFGADASCYKGTLHLHELKKSLRHVVAVSTWLHGNGSAGRTFVMNDETETQNLVWATLVSLLGIPADPRWGAHLLDELRRDNKVNSMSGIGCSPSVIEVTREEMLERIGRACAGRRVPFPEVNGPVVWPSFEMRNTLVVAA